MRAAGPPEILRDPDFPFEPIPGTIDPVASCHSHGHRRDIAFCEDRRLRRMDDVVCAIRRAVDKTGMNDIDPNEAVIDLTDANAIHVYADIGDGFLLGTRRKCEQPPGQCLIEHIFMTNGCVVVQEHPVASSPCNLVKSGAVLADLAQLVEQLFRKQQVWGSSPQVGSESRRVIRVHAPKWRNWQTRYVQGVVGKPVGVRISPSAPGSLRRRRRPATW